MRESKFTLMLLSFFLIALLLLFRAIGPNIAHIVSYDMLQIIYCFLVICIALIFVSVFMHMDYKSRVTKKPIQSIRAKVMSKGYFGHEYYSHRYVVFLFDNRIEFRLGVSKKQYKAIKKNDIVDLVYQGIIAHAIKKFPDGAVILNEQHPQKKPKAK